MSSVTQSIPPVSEVKKPKVAVSERLLVTTCIVVPLAGLVLFFGYPLLMVALKSLTLADGSIGIGNYLKVISSPGILTALQNSLVMATLTTLITLAFAFGIAYVMERTVIRTRRIIQIVLILPLLAPSLVQGLGLIFLLGRNGIVNNLTGWGIEIYGLPGLVIANTMYAVPQAVLIIRAALRQSDARQYEAAMMLGANRRQQFFDITLPNSKFAFLSAGFVVFTIAITDFGNAAVIGGNYNVLATEIYAQVVGQMNFGMGAVVGMLLLLPTVVAVYIERVAAQQQFGGTSESSIPVEPENVPSRDWPLGTFVWIFCASVMLVIGTVVYASFVKLWPYNQSLTLANYNVTVSGGYSPLWTSFLVSFLAATIGVIFLFFLAFGLGYVRRSWAKLIYLLAVLPVGAPGLVLGLSYVLAFNTPNSMLGLLYGSAVLIAFCNFYHYHSQGFLTIMTGMRATPPALRETVVCMGGGLPNVLRDAILPFMLPTIISTFFFLFMRSMVTLSAVIFLISPKVSVAAVQVMRLDEAGLVSQAAAFSVCVMASVLAALLVMQLILMAITKKPKSGQQM
jgi:iron(III) transport system permease protein